MTHSLAVDLDHILEHTRACWNALRGARLFITGGTGFFGIWLLESLAWANEALDLDVKATVLSRDPTAFRRRTPHLGELPFLAWHQGDVRTFLYPAGPFTHVIHAATPTDPIDPAEVLDIIVGGTRHTLDFASHTGAQRFLFISSGAVYGKQPADLAHIPEDYPGAPNLLDPTLAYHEGKRSGEMLCAIMGQRSAMQVTIARCFAFLGPHLPLDVHFAAGNFLRDVLRGGPVQVRGDGSPLRSYLYAADLMIWLWKILVHGQNCRPYNVGSEEAVSIGQLANKVAELCRTTVQIARNPAPHVPPERYVPSTQRAREELGVRTWIELDEALSRTLRWHHV